MSSTPTALGKLSPCPIHPSLQAPANIAVKHEVLVHDRQELSGGVVRLVIRTNAGVKDRQYWAAALALAGWCIRRKRIHGLKKCDINIARQNSFFLLKKIASLIYIVYTSEINFIQKLIHLKKCQKLIQLKKCQKLIHLNTNTNFVIL